MTGGKGLETVLVNIAVGLVAAGAGVFAGVKVNTVKIDEMARRLERIESKVDDISKRIKW